MKKIISIVCVLFTVLTVLALPISASTPYQTYTYSIDGTALHSPDAYVPSKTVDALYMGLEDPDLLAKYHVDVADLVKKMNDEQAKMAANPNTSSEAYKTANSTYNSLKTEYNKLISNYSKLNAPGDIEVDANGNVYIADTKNNRKCR